MANNTSAVDEYEMEDEPLPDEELDDYEYDEPGRLDDGKEEAKSSKKKKKERLPTRIYSYGAFAPTTGLQLVNDIMYRRNRYRNDLVVLCNEYIKWRKDTLRRLFKPIGRMEATISKDKAKVSEAREAVTDQNVKARKKSATQVQKDKIRALDEKIKKNKKQLKQLWKDAAELDKFERLDTKRRAQFAKDKKHLRTMSGLHWGDYNSVEASVGSQGRHPAFKEHKRKRYDGSGKVTIQIQTTREPLVGEMPVGLDARVKGKKVLSLEFFGVVPDRMFVQIDENKSYAEELRRVLTDEVLTARIKPLVDVPEAELERRRQRREAEGHRYIACPRTAKECRTEAYLKIGSTTDGEHNEPVWVTIPTAIHRGREIPADGRVKVVSLVRKKRGPRTLWKLQFMVNRRDGFAKKGATTGHFCADVGWRERPHGIRVLTWSGDDGASGEVYLPYTETARWKHADELRSLRDTLHDKAKAWLKAWCKTNENIITPWLKEEIRYMHLWKSTRRLTLLVLRWFMPREGEELRRFDGDEEAYAYLELDEMRTDEKGDPVRGWRRQNKHLWQWEADERAKAVNWRNKLYEKFAADMRERYAMGYLEDTNWSNLGRRPKAEAGSNMDGIRKNKAIAAVGTLRKLIKRAMPAQKMSARYTTQRCHVCGHKQKFAAKDKAKLFHTCQNPECLAEWDRDINAPLVMRGIVEGRFEAM